MYMEHISRIVEDMVSQYGVRDPLDLCNAQKIFLLFEPMGSNADACKGFFLMQFGKRVIVVNNDLPDESQSIILSHELGHAVLHSHIAGVTEFHDFKLFDDVSKMEYEANLFAAELLLRDEDVLALLNDDISFFSAASTLCVPPELLDFKFRVMKRKGYKVIDPPLMAKSNFLKDIN